MKNLDYEFHNTPRSGRRVLFDAVAYLDVQTDGLGIDFAREVFSTINRTVDIPFGWSPLSENIRRCLCKRFPYGLIYEIVDDENVTILAIAHSSREPDYWKKFGLSLDNKLFRAFSVLNTRTMNARNVNTKSVFKTFLTLNNAFNWRSPPEELGPTMDALEYQQIEEMHSAEH